MEELDQPPATNWDRLYEAASFQDGHFTTKQAAAAGFSPQLLAKHMAAGRLRRIRHGIYRLFHYPAADNEELTVIWLWSQQAGLFSHETALALHGLSDVLPTRIHLTMPAASAVRRFRLPEGVVLHHADVPAADRAWFGAVPATSALRTLADCARDHVSPDLLMQAARQAIERGLVVRTDLVEIDRALRPYGGLLDGAA